MKRHIAVLKRKKGDGVGTARIEVIRQSDGQSLGTIRYHPDSPTSCREMEAELASIEGRYQVEIHPE